MPRPFAKVQVLFGALCLPSFMLLSSTNVILKPAEKGKLTQLGFPFPIVAESGRLAFSAAQFESSVGVLWVCNCMAFVWSQ